MRTGTKPAYPNRKRARAQRAANKKTQGKAREAGKAPRRTSRDSQARLCVPEPDTARRRALNWAIHERNRERTAKDFAEFVQRASNSELFLLGDVLMVWLLWHDRYGKASIAEAFEWIINGDGNKLVRIPEDKAALFRSLARSARNSSPHFVPTGTGWMLWKNDRVKASSDAD